MGRPENTAAAAVVVGRIIPPAERPETEAEAPQLEPVLPVRETRPGSEGPAGGVRRKKGRGIQQSGGASGVLQAPAVHRAAEGGGGGIRVSA